MWSSTLCRWFYCQWITEKTEVKPKRKLVYEKIRHPVTHKMTSVLNGNRFLYIVSLPDGKLLSTVNYYAKYFTIDSQNLSVRSPVQYVGPQITPRDFAKMPRAAKSVSKRATNLGIKPVLLMEFIRKWNCIRWRKYYLVKFLSTWAKYLQHFP